MTSQVEACTSHDFSASAERVYDAWLQPEQVRVWMSAALRSLGLPGEIVSIEIDPRVGGKFLFSDLRGEVEAKHWGTYLELDRPRKIVFTWIVDASGEADPSVVTLSIEPRDNGCRASIVHQMDVKWIEYVSRTEAGWARMLAQMGVLLG
ncbi:Activator of Hsp90 ATPase 1 family protein [Pirellula staleyi DSM 6068]|uniref:Activator of Hsp90 ATPase 1 family protein n=1 Tax=Pirellula staleyi (strain ATCC 27377 / DSM 6068 / ICPB 4128) TaxID=530564 RepID=D2QWU2_PIRSD|nr:SRPBCC family protein [Pirellula staleyi]ADB16046.1 Activator of Hsp90 ATPase 1 family protein [Pirellula staleyi DSM 6068]